MDRGSNPGIWHGVSKAGNLRDCGVHGGILKVNTAWSKTKLDLKETSGRMVAARSLTLELRFIIDV